MSSNYNNNNNKETCRAVVLERVERCGSRPSDGLPSCSTSVRAGVDPCPATISSAVVGRTESVGLRLHKSSSGMPHRDDAATEYPTSLPGITPATDAFRRSFASSMTESSAPTPVLGNTLACPHTSRDGVRGDTASSSSSSLSSDHDLSVDSIEHGNYSSLKPLVATAAVLRSFASSVSESSAPTPVIGTTLGRYQYTPRDTTSSAWSLAADGSASGSSTASSLPIPVQAPLRARRPSSVSSPSNESGNSHGHSAGHRIRTNHLPLPMPKVVRKH